MRIRSVTCFAAPAAIPQAGSFAQKAHQAFKDSGVEVQSLRLAAPPFASWIPSLQPSVAAAVARQIESQASQAGIAYVSLGPALPQDEPARQAIISILSATKNVFCSGLMGNSRQGVYLPAVRGCAAVIQEASLISQDGFANLRFCAMANVSAYSPFFPAAYSNDNGLAFALAVEAADLAVDAFSTAASLEEAGDHLVASILENSRLLARISRRLARENKLRFAGIDFTLAPYPDEAISLGAAIERLGVPAAGLSGTPAASAMVAACIDRARFPRTGFNGLMLPVLEDAVLARRAADGSLSLTTLLLCSAVCGTGLDTIPLPGDSSRDQLAAVLLDLAALACRLDKPLTARLMPVPGKQVGDPTGFDFSFFANSRVMPLSASTLTGLLAGPGWLPVAPRRRSAY